MTPGLRQADLKQPYAVVNVHSGQGTPLAVKPYWTSCLDIQQRRHDLLLLKINNPKNTQYPSIALPNCNLPLKVGTLVEEWCSMASSMVSM
ncbi:hypothetical protein EYF80_055313 [Liparis tanakae]|uniref:Uncharacterized protein n=1 Tax=Liparis tanakae TaxID=230148 RepID=A0A4Z2F188_9TELE|nr:hypothetical protein EYF80_055313 [Liparis tanakae]